MANTPRIDRLELNKIINGNFDFWQRGTGTVLMTANDQFFLADRYKTRSVNNTTLQTNVARSTDVPNPQSSYSLRLEVNTIEATLPSNGFYDIDYKVEGYDIAKLHGKKATLSFYVKSSKTGKYYINFTNSANDRRLTASYTIDAASIWEKKTIIIDTIDLTIGTWDKTSGVGLDILWCLGYGTNFIDTITEGVWTSDSVKVGSDQTKLHETAAATFQISQVMLNEGEVAGEFSRAGRTIAEELGLCERYYEIGQHYFAGQCLALSGSQQSSTFRVTKRVVPTMAFTSQLASAFQGNANGVAMGVDSCRSGQTKNGASGNGAWQNSYTADAEL